MVKSLKTCRFIPTRPLLHKNWVVYRRPKNSSFAAGQEKVQGALFRSSLLEVDVVHSKFTLYSFQKVGLLTTDLT